jgi:hypothetical protein
VFRLSSCGSVAWSGRSPLTGISSKPVFRSFPKNRSTYLTKPHLQKGLRTFMAARRLVLPEICTPIDLAGD